VLKRTFGAQREEVGGGSRGLHNEELHNFIKYYYNDQVNDDAIGDACTT
jgi:hypothetical protein